MRFLISLFLLVFLVGGSWFYLRGSPLPRIGDGGTESETSRSDEAVTVASSPEAAESGAAKLERLQLDMEEIWLSGEELTSLFAQRTDLWDLGMVTPPEIRIEGDKLSIRASVDPARLPEIRGLEEIRRILPSDVGVAVAGTIDALSGADALVQITDAEVAGITIPTAILPSIIGLLDLPGGSDVPNGAFLLPLPRGANHARVADDHLILGP
jgi:hypothetical protein